ncbi:MAG: 4'-phosphopantetheinyl transferase superfamily protein [Deltaproteobacteria bacterium]|nr:MAG: 4'-phosphopantetheinyl transferase superfamily protein [Deltaproteobacteria bacterium]
MTETATLYPVILSVPEHARNLPVRPKGKYLSRYAREALAISAQKSGVKIGRLKKNTEGAPVPSGGIYWSLTHKPMYVGAVVGLSRVGIDIEKINSRSNVLFKKTAGPDEWALGGYPSWELFYRYWTSKEAVVKAAGKGIFQDLSECRVIQIIDQNNLVIKFRGNRWHLEHFYFHDHIASVVKNSFTIEWTLL